MVWYGEKISQITFLTPGPPSHPPLLGVGGWEGVNTNLTKKDFLQEMVWNGKKLVKLFFDTMGGEGGGGVCVSRVKV